MAQIELCGIKKKYGRIEALKNIDLVIQDKEFLVLFGPAGAGKTTILKLIAGIELPTEGTVKINGETMNLMEASDRNVAMVFENYALYPHMTVYDNIAFPLRSKRYRQSEEVIRERVESVTRLMKIDGLLDRLPAQISNGQKQRVALGRSLVRTPNVFLMDEPLAHLDAKMRHFMRAELKEMQGTLSTTTLYVTHDYMEALSLGDRIAILNEGAFEQIGTGEEIYSFPANEFVAKLVGEPEINIFPVRLKRENGKTMLVVLGMESALSPGAAKILEGYAKPELDFGIRAKFIQYHLSKPGGDCIKGKVYSFEPIGNRAILLVDAEDTLLRLTVPNDVNIEINTDVYLTLHIERALFFDSDDKSLIRPDKGGEIIWPD